MNASTAKLRINQSATKGGMHTKIAAHKRAILECALSLNVASTKSMEAGVLTVSKAGWKPAPWPFAKALAGVNPASSVVR
ncbi:MAG: hypothetical protein DKT66_19475 [Candidatus Melainabacteria bacterium]|nr:MAG: hypothetical protein DKT66_19475 [Candidatus Melainabacteria bacterium]